MADFLNRLAARAIGAVPLAEPAVPTRFSSGAQPMADLGTELPARQSLRNSIETSEDRHSRLPMGETSPHFDTRVARPPSPFQDVDEATDPSRSHRAPAFPRQAPAPAPFAVSSQEEDEVGTSHRSAMRGPAAHTVERAAAYHPLDTATVRAAIAETQSASRLTRLAEPMRSSAAQQSERLQALRPLPPTVSVSIGRIEVRAEIASPSPTAPVQRPRSSTLSLDQFLKQADGSAR